MKFQIRRSRTKGVGAFALDAIEPGTLVMRFTGKKLHMNAVFRLMQNGRLNEDDPLHISKNYFLVLDKLPRALNHSCDPNCGFQSPTKLVAIKKIRPGDELTYDYSTVVPAVAINWSMKCLCKAPRCRRQIGSIATLPNANYRQYLKLSVIPNWIRRSHTKFRSQKKPE